MSSVKLFFCFGLSAAFALIPTACLWPTKNAGYLSLLAMMLLMLLIFFVITGLTLSYLNKAWIIILGVFGWIALFVFGYYMSNHFMLL